MVVEYQRPGRRSETPLLSTRRLTAAATILLAATVFPTASPFVPAPSSLLPRVAVGWQRIGGGTSNRNLGTGIARKGTPVGASDNLDDGEFPNADRRTLPSKAEMTGGNDLGYPDSLARRQLVLTLLASTSLVPLTASAATNIDRNKPILATAASAENVGKSKGVYVLRPPTDKRAYEAYELENGLKVLLCSDPSSSTAAAGMNVHVGACSDPVEVPGLAHFCEHMLFLGTELYPEEGSFSKFLSVNGGSNNAFTDSEKTVYYFEMNGERFSDALLRFGSFFTSPLFTEAATGRELNAIESENSKNLQNDIFRLYQLEKARVNSEHPYSKFFTGNKATLLESTKRQGIDLRKELVKFYESNYSANQMSLAVVGPQSISDLKKYVAEGFGDVPNRGVDSPEEAWAFKVQPYADGKSLIPAKKSIVEIVPIQELRQVTITWPIVFASKEERDAYRLNQPDFFVASLLGHEGSGSLLSYLKSKGFANSLGASDNAVLSDFATFEATVELTNKGLENVDEVCEAIFSYVRMLQTNPIPDYIFNEGLQLEELEWRFASKSQPMGYVQSLVTAMDQYPPSLYVAGPRRLALKETRSSVISSDDPRTSLTKEQLDIAKASCTDLIERLTVDNSYLTVFSKTFEGKTNNVEKWYGTKYNVRPIPALTLMRFMNSAPAATLGLSYPRKNVFIPSESGLRVIKKIRQADLAPRSFEEKIKPLTPPSVIRDDGDDGRWTVHFKQDDRFGQPKAFLIFQLQNQELYSSPTKACLASLYQTCAADLLNEYTYDARLAGLTYDLQVLPRGVRLTFGGYNDKLKSFASYVSSKLAREFDDVLPATEEEFDRYKDNLIRSLKAFDVKQPYSHATYYSSLTQVPRNFQYTNSEIRTAMVDTTLQQLKDYVKTLWGSGKGEALIQGNYDKREALEVVDLIDKTLAFQPISSDQYPKRLRPLPLPVVANEQPTRLLISDPNPSNNNAATQVSFQCLGKTEKEHVLIEILAAVIEEPLFDDLRTKQQLGYIVSSGVKAVDQSRTLNVIVQSSVAPAEKLTSAILNFLDGVRVNQLDKLSDADVELFVKGLVDRRLEPDKRLSVETTRNWSEIASGRLQFDRLQSEVAALLDLSKADIINFWDTLYVKERRILVSEIVPKVGKASSKEPALSSGYVAGKSSSALGIDDIERFRENGERAQKNIIV